MIPLRRLADVRAAGDLIWFQGALDRLRTLRHEADPRLRAFFSDGSPVYIARAPGRLDVMGGIADYSGARVLELPLECSTAALLQRQATADCDLATRRAGSWQFFSAELAPLVERDGALSTPAALAAWFAGRESERWASYVVGIVQLCLQRAVREGRGRTPGLRLLIDSTVPAGRGVASSAALEVAARTAAFMGYRMIAAAARLPAQREGARLRIDAARWRGHLANLTGPEWAALAGGLPEEISGAEFLKRYGGITDTATTVHSARRYPVRPATEHPVREQARVERFAELLGVLADEPQAAVELGRLMGDSHKSYGACGLGSDGTDRLVELVAAEGPERGLFGAKITGGGSGGTVAGFAPSTRDLGAE